LKALGESGDPSVAIGVVDTRLEVDVLPAGRGQTIGRLGLFGEGVRGKTEFLVPQVRMLIRGPSADVLRLELGPPNLPGSLTVRPVKNALAGFKLILPVERELRLRVAELPSDSAMLTAQTLVGEWLHRRGTAAGFVLKGATSTIGRVSSLVDGDLIDELVDDDNEGEDEDGEEGT
jgi:hypothetical protein